MARYRALIICTSPRSGSTLLCRMLAATGYAGLPESHFHEPSLAAWLADHGLRPDDYPTDQAAIAAVVAAARAAGTDASGMFGLRLQHRSFDFFALSLARLHPGLASDAHRITAAFGPALYVHLSRSDKLDQAISFVKASQTGLWHRAPDGTEIERLSPPRTPVYDAAAIAAKIAEFTSNDADWSAWFDRENIAPLKVHYEYLSADPQQAVGRVLHRLGAIHFPAATFEPPVARLADGQSRAWRARFLAEQRTRS